MPDASTVTHLVVLRHGQTQWSLDRRHTDRSDIPLTEEGRLRSAANRLSTLDVSRVGTSPCSRSHTVTSPACPAARWLRFDPGLGRTFSINPGSRSMLAWKREFPAVLRWNEACHLEGERCAHSVSPE